MSMLGDSIKAEKKEHKEKEKINVNLCSTYIYSLAVCSTNDFPKSKKKKNKRRRSFMSTIKCVPVEGNENRFDILSLYILRSILKMRNLYASVLCAQCSIYV